MKNVCSLLIVASLPVAGLAACGNDAPVVGTCNCPADYISNPAYGGLTFEYDGVQTVRSLRAIAPTAATLVDGVVSLTCVQAAETFTLKVPASAAVGSHDLSAASGYSLVLTEQSSDVSPSLRGDYAGVSSVYGTFNLTAFSPEKDPTFIGGALDAVLPLSGNSGVTVHAQLQIQADFATTAP